MKTLIFNKMSSVGLAAIFCFGCSSLNPMQKQTSQTSENKDTATGKTAETSLPKSPCTNKYYPVKDGFKRNYDNKVGGKTTLTMEYKEGDASFTEVTTLKDVTVKHVWNCTNEGFVAANYGSAAEISNMQLTPKHISGVTLPTEDEIKVGKAWTAVYQATGTSQIGAIDTTVELHNKIVSLDDEVKTSAGIFKAVKIEIEIVSDMKLGGKKMPVPKIQSAAWFAPGIGMIKSTGAIGGISNTMQYAGSD